MTRSPSVSVVVPVRNGAAGLRRAVESALAQTHPLDVVIAVAPSDDGTEEVAEQLAQSERVTVVPNPAGGTASGLNAAIAASFGDVIVRCDSFAELPPEYVASALETLDETGAANVGGMQVASGETRFERAVAIAVSGMLGAGGASHRVGGEPGPVDTVYLGVFRRDAVERVGGFDERFVRSQDSELNLRLIEAGETVWFDPRLRVRYWPRRTVVSLWRQYFQYGWWRLQVARLHRGSLRLRQIIPPLFVLGLLASAALVPVSAAALVLPVTYVAVIGAATIGNLVWRRDSAALLLPIVLPTIHIAWGVGFLAAQFSSRPE